MDRKMIAATLVVASAWARAAFSQEPPAGAATPGGPPPAECARPADAEAVVRCALMASPEVRAARAELGAASGRKETAGVVLPSNPALSGTFAHRNRPPPDAASAPNWSLSISQELEIAGQRSARVDAADAEISARERRVAVAEQEVAAGALAAYYEAIAARESMRFAAELAEGAKAIAAYAEGRAKEAVVAGVEADVARAEATRIGLVRLEAERRFAESRAALAVLLGVGPDALVVADALPPFTGTQAVDPGLEDQALRLRGEVSAAEMERRVLERRLALVRRTRIPNPTISAFVAREEIDDRVYGVGLSIPLPLPSPVGRTRAGEITEAVAQLQAAEASAELVRRRVRLEVARAAAGFAARQGAATLFAPDLLARARADLASIREAVGARQLTLREGLLWQRSLIELLQEDIDARLGRALAWVELRRVVGIPFAPGRGGQR
jgi:cobalt-zinc-cadmium efflux system outer membrane protein